MARTHPHSQGEDEVFGLEPLMEATKVIVAVVARSIARAGEDLSVPQLRVLVMIAARGEMNLSAVAEGLGVNPSNASRTCDRLVAQGMLTRRADERDRRHLVLALSGEGREVLDRILDQRRALLGEVVRRMPPTRRRRLDDTMTAFVDAARRFSESEGIEAEGEGHLLRWLT